MNQPEGRYEVHVSACRPAKAAREIKPIHVTVLARSIEQIGLLQPIVVRAAEGGFEVMAGLHRLKAFEMLGRDKIPAIVRHDDDLRAELALIDENLIRNELTPVERDIAIARRKTIYEALHPETVVGATGKGRPKVRHDGEPIDPAERFSKVTAEATGHGERTIQRSVARVEAIGEETMAKLVDTPLNEGGELDALAQLSPHKREEIIAKATSGEKVSAKLAVKQERRDEREAELGAKQLELPEGQFGLIMVDWPRRHEVWSRETGLDRSPDNHYPTQGFEWACALPIAQWAAPDCILIMCTTAASLIDDIEIAAEWGFCALRPRDGLGKLSRPNGSALPPVGDGTYRSHQVWDKVRRGTGRWFIDRHELWLILVKGDIPCPAPGTQDESLFSEPRTEHSAKPERLLAWCDRHWPNLRKLEVFRRGEPRKGWSAWGNEAQPSSEAAE